MLGFIFGTISFGVLFMIPETLTDSHAVLYLVALLFWGLAEVIIGPLLYSVLTKYTNPNYLAILISLSTIPTRAISILALLSMSLVSDEYLNSPILQLRTALIVMAIISVGLIGFVVWKKFTTVTSNN